MSDNPEQDILDEDGYAAEVQDSQESNSSHEPETFEQQVNTLVKQMVQDDKGHWQLPEGEYPEHIAYAAKLEKRRRDTESAYGKARQELKAQAALVEELQQEIAARMDIQLSSDEREELEVLKYDDPEAWRKKINEYEKRARDSMQKEINEITSKASQQAEIERRKQVLQEFNESHQDAQIDDETILEDLPPRIIRRLEKGEVSFEEFLQEAYDYLVMPKKVGSPNKTMDQPNLGSVGGKNSPTKQSIVGDIEASYINEVY
jgi:hypothetical protein